MRGKIDPVVLKYLTHFEQEELWLLRSSCCLRWRKLRLGGQTAAALAQFKDLTRRIFRNFIENTEAASALSIKVLNIEIYDPAVSRYKP